jgi:hypothetical protein
MTLRTSLDSVRLFAGWLPNLAPRPAGITECPRSRARCRTAVLRQLNITTATVPASAQPASERLPNTCVGQAVNHGCARSRPSSSVRQGSSTGAPSRIMTS